MTSTHSAAVTGLPDRRHFLSTIAGAGALVIPALPAFAGAPGPIEALYWDYLRLKAEDDAADARADDAYERYHEPPQPLWNREFDEGRYSIIKAAGRNVLEEGGCYFNNTGGSPITAVIDCDNENIARLKDLISIADESSVGGSSDALFEKFAAAARRAEKTLRKIEIWQAEERRFKDAAGLTQAEAVCERTSVAIDAQYEAIIAIEAATLRELAFQAAIVDAEGDTAGAAFVLERLVELAGVTPHSANA